MFQDLEVGYEVWSWAEPLVHDTLQAVYDDALGGGDVAKDIAREHARLWGRLADKEPDLVGLMELEMRLMVLGHGLELIHRANAAVAIELADTLRRRFRASERTRAGFALAVEAIDDTARGSVRALARRSVRPA